MAGNHSELEKRLWDAADELRANSKLKSSEYSVPVLGLIFLRFAANKFAAVEKELAATVGQRQRSKTISKTDYLARCVYLPEQARFQRLLNLPEGANLGKEFNDAMKAIEDENTDLKGVLAMMNLPIRGIEGDLGPEHADTFRRDLHQDLKAGRHAFPETICHHTTTLGTLNAP